MNEYRDSDYFGGLFFISVIIGLIAGSFGAGVIAFLIGCVVLSFEKR